MAEIVVGMVVMGGASLMETLGGSGGRGGEKMVVGESLMVTWEAVMVVVVLMVVRVE